MSNIIDLETARMPHTSGPAMCIACNHEWIAVAPVGIVGFDCPSCGSARGIRAGHVFDEDENLNCSKCDSFAFGLLRNGNAQCLNCGEEYRPTWKLENDA